MPDTQEGRFEVIALHLVLVLRRLAREGEQGSALGQAVTEAFVVDLDDSLREMTVGDLAVPRQVKHAVAVLHDRYSTYGAALTAVQDGLLVAAIEQRLGALRGAEGLDVRKICAYIGEAVQVIELQPGPQVLGGDIAWPQVRT